jgi:hypothetical protein
MKKVPSSGEVIHMVSITRIDVKVVTGDRKNAGTNGYVFLGIGGREFRLDSGENDFERNTTFLYHLGDIATVLNADLNDPRSPQLDTADLASFRVYIRFEPAGRKPGWNLEEVEVIVNPGADGTMKYKALEPKPDVPDPHLWLSQDCGKICYLRTVL